MSLLSSAPQLASFYLFSSYSDRVDKGPEGVIESCLVPRSDYMNSGRILKDLVGDDKWTRSVT